MADYYEVESNGRGGYTVTPRDNSGCLTAFIVVLVIAIVFLFSRCDHSDGNSGNIPANEIPNNTSIADRVASEGNLALFSIPYVHSMDGGIKLVSDSQGHTDLEGRLHDKCYVLLCKGNHEYGVVYELEGAFSELSGELYAQNEGTVCWLEFYDGDSLIYSTEKLSEENTSCSVNVNISNIHQLTIYFCSEDKGNPMYDSGWLITENFVIK